MSEHRSVHLCGQHLRDPRHICCFFDTRDQQYEVLTPYFQEGIATGEQVFCVMEDDLVPDHRARLAAAGVDVDAEERTGRMMTRSSNDHYLSKGRFDKETMYALLEEYLHALDRSPFPGLRACGDMAWALRNMPGTNQLMEYESEVNGLLKERTNATFLCVYDANRISGQAMIDILSTHSHVIIGNQVHENPYYMAPNDYKRAFMARRANAHLAT